MTEARLAAPGAPTDSWLMRGSQYAAAVIVALLACFAGLSAGSGSPLLVVLPLAGVVGLGLGLLAMRNFQAFLLVTLVARASLDLAKVSSKLGSEDTATRALDPASMLGLLFLFVAAVWLMARRQAKGLVPGSFLRRALLAFVVAGMFSVAGTEGDPLPSLLEVTRILSAVLMFVVLEQMMAEKKHMRTLLMGVYMSSIFPLLMTAWGFAGGGARQEIKGDFERVTGPFGQSNTFGRYLMLMIIFGVAIFPYLEKGYRRLFAVLLSGSAIVLVLTFTRSALVATVFGLVAVALAQGKKVLVGVIVLATFGLLSIPQVNARFSDLTEDESTVDTSPNSVDWRLAQWTSVLPYFKSSPVTGVGLSKVPTLTSNEAQTHNDFVRVLVETGVLGILAYLAVLAAILGLGRRAVLAAPRGTFDHAVAAGFFGCAVAFLAVSVVANVISNVVTLWYFFAFAAAASSVVRRNTPEHPGEAPASLEVVRTP